MNMTILFEFGWIKCVGGAIRKYWDRWTLVVDLLLQEGAYSKAMLVQVSRSGSMSERSRKQVGIIIWVGKYKLVLNS